jgi:hypothetical protein
VKRRVAEDEEVVEEVVVNPEAGVTPPRSKWRTSNQIL